MVREIAATALAGLLESGSIRQPSRGDDRLVMRASPRAMT
jgi:hypothetical protein